jgi:MmgE/PrpD N-terminal domain
LTASVGVDSAGITSVGVSEAVARFAVGPLQVPADLLRSSTDVLDRCRTVVRHAVWPAELAAAAPGGFEREAAFEVAWSLANEAGSGGAGSGEVGQEVPVAAAVWAASRSLTHAGAVAADEETVAPDKAGAAVAVAIGWEIARRLLVVLGPALRDQGWDPARFTAGIAAAAAVARVLALDADRTVAAIAAASTQAAGLQVPPRLARVQWAKAAVDGVVSARLAAYGLTAPAAPLEGRRGLAALVAPGTDPVGIVSFLGTQWWAASV